VGNFYSARASWELAERHFKSALRINGDYADAWLGLARVYRSVDKYDEYRDSINRLRKLEVQDMEASKEIGVCDLRFGDHTSAIQCFERILEQRPDDVDAHINLALAYKYEGIREDAERHNLRALELKEDSVEALSNLGHLYYEATQYDKAREMYIQAIQLEEGLVDVHVRLANVCLLHGEIEKCVDACDSILRTLNVPYGKKLQDIQDLAEVFFLISSRLREFGNGQLSHEAQQTGNFLRRMQREESSTVKA
jgi:tetratricopeptide (TPR) repeat protein